MRLVEPRGLTYREVLDLQRALVEEVAAGAEPALVLVEHERVVTAGRAVKEPPPGAIEVERGGDITVHGPGQIVGYPIVRLHDHDVRGHLRHIERLLIAALADLGIAAGTREGATGVWVAGERKIASIGIAVRRWVTYHGFALNVTTDLSIFEGVRPCGFEPAVMTSVERELGRAPNPGAARNALIEAARAIL